MADKCTSDCKDMNDVRDTLYDKRDGLVYIISKKISWKQLGAVIAIVCAILGVTYINIDWGHAEGLRKAEAHIETNSKQIQTFSVNQAVIADRVKTIDDNVKKMEEQRKQDVQTIHSRISEVQKSILKAISEIKK